MQSEVQFTFGPMRSKIGHFCNFQKRKKKKFLVELDWSWAQTGRL